MTPGGPRSLGSREGGRDGGWGAKLSVRCGQGRAWGHRSRLCTPMGAAHRKPPPAQVWEGGSLRPRRRERQAGGGRRAAQPLTRLELGDSGSGTGFPPRGRGPQEQQTEEPWVIPSSRPWPPPAPGPSSWPQAPSPLPCAPSAASAPLAPPPSPPRLYHSRGTLLSRTVPLCFAHAVPSVFSPFLPRSPAAICDRQRQRHSNQRPRCSSLSHHSTRGLPHASLPDCRVHVSWHCIGAWGLGKEIQ